jgi:hypothetical protein
MKHVAVACAAFCAVLLPLSAEALPDACSFLTEAQIGAAVGFTVGKGTHVTPTFLQTCTWTATGGTGVQTVTLNIQTAAFFDGAKKTAGMMIVAGGALKPAGVGEDSFYALLGTQVSLWVKKGGTAFKLAIYKEMAIDQKESMELALAREVVPKL